LTSQLRPCLPTLAATSALPTSVVRAPTANGTAAGANAIADDLTDPSLYLNRELTWLAFT